MDISNGFKFEGMGLIPRERLRGWAVAKITLFSEYGHVADQIKAFDTCSNMAANILPTGTSSTSHFAQQIIGN